MRTLLSTKGLLGRFALGVAAGLTAQGICALWIWLREPATNEQQRTAGSEPGS
jgi:hypothetical protein